MPNIHPDNSSYQFVPTITKKYYEAAPIPPQIIAARKQIKEKPSLLQINYKTTPSLQILPHPYIEEISKLEFPASMLTTEFKPIPPKKVEETPISIIDTPEKLKKLKKILLKQTEIAVDLEAHSTYSYQGITCLMQISTRDEDYIVDTLLLYDHIKILRKVFANPSILKVLHGSDFDIKWLQRDFSIYVVNMFDTGQAARILQLGRYSYQFLLNQICNTDTDKSYQLADWRLRPLTTEMLLYARTDTHYLLYIYDELKKKLIDKAISENYEPTKHLLATLEKSKYLCKQIYIKPEVKDLQYHSLLAHNSTTLNKDKMRVLKAMMKWRDYIGRIEDVNSKTVLTNSHMFKIVADLPTNVKQLRESFIGYMPNYLKKHQDHILELINRKLIPKVKALPIEREEESVKLIEATDINITSKIEVEEYNAGWKDIITTDPKQSTGESYSQMQFIKMLQKN